MQQSGFTLDTGSRKTVLEISARGRLVLTNPVSNRGTAFTDAEREQLNLAGLLTNRVSSIEDFKKAYAEAHAGDEAAMIHIETDLYGPNPPGSSWWDVAVSGVSRLESTQRAYEQYLQDRRPQRHYL